MKGKILKVTIVAAFALIAGMNVYNAQKSDVMSDLALANVEALATSVKALVAVMIMGVCCALIIEFGSSMKINIVELTLKSPLFTN